MKEDEDTEKEDEADKAGKEKRLKKTKKSSESDDEEDGIGHPKGRDFDLNQIRLELKGMITKVPTVEIDKDSVLSSDDSSEKVTVPLIKEEPEEIPVKVQLFFYEKK